MIAQQRTQIGAIVICRFGEDGDVPAFIKFADVLRVFEAKAAETNLVFGAVAALPDAMREALVAVDVLGLSYAEAGKALGVHENTIPSRLARARLKVAEALG